MSSESPPPSVPEGQPDSRAALLERAWGLVESGLLTQAARIFQEVHLTLARSGKDDLVRLGRELALQIGAVAHAYRAAARAGHERAVGVLLGSQKTASAAAPGSGLSLMGLDESDISGRVEQASARLRDLVLDPWMDLAGRLQTLAGGALAEGELPLSPGLFVQAAADGLGLGGEAPLALVRGLPAALAPDLTATYEAISRMLAESGVEARAVARAAPVLRPSGPATMHRPVPPTIHRDASGTLEDPLLGVDIEAASAPARRAGAGRAVPVIDHEVPEQQPDAWGLREYVRLQALFGVNASVLFDSAMQRLQDGPETAGIVRDAPSRALIGAMIAAQKLDAAHVGGLQRRSSSAGAEGKGAPAVPGQAAAADAPLKSNDAAGQEPLGTREYSRRLIGLAALPVHKHTVHLVARIFARVERDRIVPEAVRAQLVALRFPFMEAALADPSIFVRPEHAARGLINTIASSSVNWSADAPAGRRYLQQVRTTVQYILGSPGAAAGAFTQAQEQFSAFVAEQARLAGDAPLASAREALRAAEEREGRALEVGAFLRDLLAGAPLDPDLRQFLVRDWARVLVEATEGESEQPGLLQRMLSVIPDLVWSVQPVTSAPERKRFADVVPVILANLRDGVTRIGWSGTRLKRLVDHLRQVHARSLAAGDAPAAGEVFTVSTLRIRLDGFRMDTLSGPPRLKPFELVDEAVRHFLDQQACGVSHRRVQADKGPDSGSAAAVLDAGQAEQIIDRWRPGNVFDLRIGRTALRARLEGFTPSRSLALFSTTAEPALVSLSHASLVACVRHGWIAPVEPMALLARAFRTVLSDLKRSAQAAAEGGNLGT